LVARVQELAHNAYGDDRQLNRVNEAELARIGQIMIGVSALRGEEARELSRRGVLAAPFGCRSPGERGCAREESGVTYYTLMWIPWTAFNRSRRPQRQTVVLKAAGPTRDRSSN